LSYPVDLDASLSTLENELGAAGVSPWARPEQPSFRWRGGVAHRSGSIGMMPPFRTSMRSA